MSEADINSEVAWIVRPYQEGDELRLPAFAEESRGYGLDLDFWRWLFRDNPAGPAPIYFADDNGRLAGHYAIVPFRLRIQGREVVACQGLEAITHPDYRRQGIMLALARRAYADVVQEGVDLIYGFPNTSSVGGFLKHLEFDVPENLPVLVRPLDLPRLLVHQRGPGLLPRLAGPPGQWGWDRLWPLRPDAAGVTVGEVAAFPDAVDALCQRVLAGIPNAVIRDRAFLDWRYCRHPLRRYRIYLAHRGEQLRGFCVSGRFDFKGLEIGVLLDLFGDVDDTAALAALGSRVLLDARAEGLPAMAAIGSADSPFRPVLRRLGFRYTARTFPLVVRVIGGGLEPAGVARGEDWYVSFGDGDFV